MFLLKQPNRFLTQSFWALILLFSLKTNAQTTYRMTLAPQTSTAASGILYDSGGPNANYSDNENEDATQPSNVNNYTFNIQPTGFNVIELRLDSLGIEPNFDTLTIYDANNGALLDRISGTSNRPLIFQVQTGKLKIQFRSDFLSNSRGFKLSWQGVSSFTAPNPTTCAAPEVIPALPFTATRSTCYDQLNGVTDSPCDDDIFYEGKDHIFKYTSKGNECVQISITDFVRSSKIGIEDPSGLNFAVFKGCPSDITSICLQKGILTIFKDTSNILNMKFDDAGDYYIAVSRREACTPFTISITSIPCLNELAYSGTCDDALSLNDCTNKGVYDLVVDFNNGGDPNFLKVDPPSPNIGCIQSLSGVTPPQYNYAFFYLKANENGKLGFTIESLNKDLATDFDFQVYGPIDKFSDICAYSRSNTPIRCSGGQESTAINKTGMADSYILNGQTVTVKEDTEDATGDGLVRRLDVQKGKYYVIWINDWAAAVGSNPVRFNFSGTTEGVLDSASNPLAQFTAGTDTVICPNGVALLKATGGSIYKWTPDATLDDSFNATPKAYPTQSTVYSVNIQGTCQNVTKTVNVGVLKLNTLNDITVCKGDERTFNAGETYSASSGVTWTWTSSTGHLSELSCTNCPKPIFKATNTTSGDQVHTFTVTLKSNSCTLTKTFNVTVKAQQGANYQVFTYPKSTRDTNLCIGTNFNLLKTGFDAAATYTWSSSPSNSLSGNNPSVAPTVSTKYYVTVTGGAGGCTTQKADSVIVNIFNPAKLTVISDTTLCAGNTLVLGNTITEENTVYSWNPTTGIDKPNVANPTLTVQSGTTEYTLTALNLGGCLTTSKVKITGVLVNVSLNTADSIRICKGTSQTLLATTNVPDANVSWISNRDFSVFDSTGKKSIIVKPTTLTQYIVKAFLPGCVKYDTTRVYLDSVPFNMRITPQDTVVCEGTQVTFKSPIFEPVYFPGLTFKWDPSAGAITPDSFYNLVITAANTITYKRTATIGVCKTIDTVRIIVNKIPVLKITPKDTVLCGPKSVTLSATSVPINATDWKWKENGQELKQFAGKTSITVTPTTSTSYTVEAKIGDCPGSADANIVVETPPVFEFPSPPAVCPGGSVVLNNSPRTSYKYQWTGPNGFTSTAGAPSVSPTIVSRYAVKITSAAGCVVDTAVTITPATATLDVTADTTVCAGVGLTLTANGTTNVAPSSYFWSTGVRTQAITPQTTTSQTYSVVYTYGPGCTLQKNVRVTIRPSFSLRISPDTFSQNRLVDQGTSIVLNALTNASSPSYSWTQNGNSLGAGASATFTATDEKHGVVLSVTSAGCKKDTTLTVYVRIPNYQIPNAFSPNGDELNNYFGVIFYENPNEIIPPTNQKPRFWKGNIKVESFQVYSRLGLPVYTETNESVLNSTTYRGWDGKKGSSDMPSDVYVYVIKLRMPDGSQKIESGELNLIR